MNIFAFLAENQAAYLIAVAVLGLLVGSFLNVVIYRLPDMLKRQWRQDCEMFLAESDGKSAKQTKAETNDTNLVTPRSYCPKCHQPVSALDNIPVISYLLLGGKCRHCSTKISLRYPLVETLSALLVLVVALQFGFSPQAGLAMLLTWALLSLSFIDYDHQYLPDNITLPFLWLGLLANLFGVYTDLESALIGAIAGYLILWSVYKLFKAITGKEGMGYGDFKLLAMLGAWLGWQLLPAIILLSSLAGAVIGLLLILFKKQDRHIPIPFGPYLAIAGWLALLWGDQLNKAYINWTGM